MPEVLLFLFKPNDNDAYIFITIILQMSELRLRKVSQLYHVVLANKW